MVAKYSKVSRPAEVGWDAIIALGSNVGDKIAHIEAAVDALCAGGNVRLIERSRNYRTPPWGVTDQHWFVNAAVSVATELSPRELLACCQQIEAKLGRIKTKHWGPRVIDLDILIYRDEVIDSPELSVPHPRITERAFVLVPLADIAPDLILNGKQVRDWLTAIDAKGVTPIAQNRK